MTAYEFYSRARLLKKQIFYDLQDLAILRETSISAQFGGCGGSSFGRVEGGTPQSKVESAALKVVDAENKIAEKGRALEALKTEISAKIDTIDDPVERIILTWRYVMLKSWEDIILITGYSRAQVFRIHKKAMRRNIT